MLDLDLADFDLLEAACTGHSDGHTVGDIRVLTCWDADRLDLGRVGIKSLASRLCTSAAKDAATIEWAWRRSLGPRAD